MRILPARPISSLCRDWPPLTHVLRRHHEGTHMTSMTRQYSAAASHARNAVEKTADVWTEGARTVTDRLSGLPQVDLVPAVNRYFDFVQWTVDFNRRLA